MERTSDFEQLLFLYKTEGKGLARINHVSTMALTIVSLTDGTAINMKVSSQYMSDLEKYHHARASYILFRG